MNAFQLMPARMSSFNDIEVFYNRRRLHRGVDYAFPLSRVV